MFLTALACTMHPRRPLPLPEGPFPPCAKEKGKRLPCAGGGGAPDPPYPYPGGGEGAGAGGGPGPSGSSTPPRGPPPTARCTTTTPPSSPRPAGTPPPPRPPHPPDREGRVCVSCVRARVFGLWDSVVPTQKIDGNKPRPIAPLTPTNSVRFEQKGDRPENIRILRAHTHGFIWYSTMVEIYAHDPEAGPRARPSLTECPERLFLHVSGPQSEEAYGGGGGRGHRLVGELLGVELRGRRAGGPRGGGRGISGGQCKTLHTPRPADGSVHIEDISIANFHVLFPPPLYLR